MSNDTNIDDINKIDMLQILIMKKTKYNENCDNNNPHATCITKSF